MNEPTTMTMTTNSEENQVLATSTLQEALRALKVPDQAVALLAGFRVMTPKRDLLGTGWTS